jgi:thiol-disulfide isomerase/thioredoxin
MVKRVTLSMLAALAVAGLLLIAVGLLSSQAGLWADQAEAGRGAPPVTGAVADFTPIDPPRPAPQRGFVDGAGNPVSLADFRGQVVLLNFWATWCAPCVEEMPSLDRLQATLGGRGFTVVALSQDFDGAAKVPPFYEKLGLAHLDIYLDPKGETMRGFSVQGLPTTILIDREGRAVGALTGPAEWDSPEAVALIEHYLGGAPTDEGLIRTGG